MVILDTDIGGDADDAVAVAVAARQIPDLALVITTHERRGDRARFVRHFLDLLGRSDVPVISGAELGETQYFCVDGLIPEEIDSQPTDVVAGVASVCDRTAVAVPWVGLGPPSNLKHILQARPDLADRLIVTQMGGAFQYRKPGQAEHNFRIDPAAVSFVCDKVPELSLVISDVTFTDDLEISARSPIYSLLSKEDAPSWASLLKEHLDRWFQFSYPSTIQHDGLTLSAALGLSFVEFAEEHVSVDEIGRMWRDPLGRAVRVSRGAHYSTFMRWLEQQLDFGSSLRLSK